MHYSSQVMTFFEGMVPAAVLAHLASECDRLLPAPLSLGACERSLLLLTVRDGRARIVGTVSFPESFTREREYLAEEVARRLDELQDLVGETTTDRWPLDEGSGGTARAALEGDVLKAWFSGSSDEVRLADFGLPNYQQPRASG